MPTHPAHDYLAILQIKRAKSALVQYNLPSKLEPVTIGHNLPLVAGNEALELVLELNPFGAGQDAIERFPIARDKAIQPDISSPSTNS
jgi:hypothetical protein